MSKTTVGEATITGLMQYLATIRDMRGTMSPHTPPAGWRWSSVEDLLLTHGRAWAKAPLPANVRPMPVKQCFANALRLARRRKDLTYVEGYGWNIIPCEHAWCVDRAGNVVDPTWTGPLWNDKPIEYFGLPLNIKWVAAMLRGSRTYGLLYNYELGWPLMRLDPAVYLDPRWAA